MDDWILNTSKLCPVGDGIRVEVELRNGTHDTSLGTNFVWDEQGLHRYVHVVKYRIVDDNDIISYRGIPSVAIDKSEVEDPINPSYYKTEQGMQPVDVIEAFDLDAHLATAVIYLLRCGRKDEPKQEIGKAIWWLNRKLEKL